MGSGLAILAAILFALGTVLQQKGTMATGDDDTRFLLHILRRPVWLAGAGLQASGWVVQAMALDRASLVVVQSLTALSLVLALPLGVALTGQHIGRRELAGAIFTMLGIVFFISAGQPQGGTTHPDAAAWWTACLVTGALVGILFPPSIIGTAIVGAAIGGVSGHLWKGMSRTDVKEFGEAIDSGEAALVIVGETTIEDAIEKASLKAQKKVAKELQVDKKDVDKAVQEAAQSIS